MTRLGLALPLLAACARPPEGSVFVQFDTDAPLPSADAALSGTPPLFDTLQIMVIGGDGQPVPGSGRTTDLYQGMFDDGPLTFAVVPAKKGERVLLQVMLFRKDHLASRFDPLETDLAARFLLPAAPSEGQTHASVFLGVDRTGRHDGWDGDLEATTDVWTRSRAGSWARARPSHCKSDPLPDEVCVPGGAFWMGDPEMRGNADLSDSDRERLVVMSPFFLDRHEVTVKEFLERWPDLRNGFFDPPLEFVAGEGEVAANFATFSAEGAIPPERLDLPVNGVPWSTAKAYCELGPIKKTLPTEAMFEYAASGAGHEWPYAWGVAPPSCDRAVLARAGIGAFVQFEGDCRIAGTRGGPAEPGHGSDRVMVGGAPGQVLLDLAGNLSEWTLDGFTDQAKRAPSNRVLFDPVEPDGAAASPPHVVKGGSWRSGFVAARAGARAWRNSDWSKPEEYDVSIGFRCARPAR